MAIIFKEKKSKKFLFKCHRCSGQALVTNSSCSSCTIFVRKIRKKFTFNCQFCDKQYVNKYALYKHISSHVRDSFVCQECGQIFDTKYKYKTHKSDHLKKRAFKCNLCKARFIYKRQYTLHMKRHSRYSCLKCNQSFASKARVLMHKRRGHPVKGLDLTFSCLHCPKLFHYKYSLKRHLKLHNENKFIRCDFCDKIFSSEKQYSRHCSTKRHELKAPIVKNLTCDYCGKQFDKQPKLQLHIKRVHENKNENFICEFCAYMTKNSTNFNRHLAMHLGNKQDFICDKCGKDFSNLDCLNNHISYIHKQTKDFLCSTCGKTFKKNSELVRHQIVHSDERLFKCPQCTCSYKRKIHLTRHLKTNHSTPVSANVPKAQDSDQMISIYDEKTGETLTFNLNEFLNDVTMEQQTEPNFLEYNSLDEVQSQIDIVPELGPFSATTTTTLTTTSATNQNYDNCLSTFLDYNFED